MKTGVKKVLSAILIIAVVFALIFLTRVLGIGTFKSGTMIGYVESGGSHNWSASYALLNGSLQHTLRPEDSDTKLKIDVVTEDGTVSIEVTGTDGRMVFKEENIPTGSFSVDVSERVDVKVKASSHKGSVNFEYSK